MTAQGLQSSLSFLNKPPPFELGQSFPTHYHQTVTFTKQHVSGAEKFFEAGDALFIRNVSLNVTYATMDPKMRRFPTPAVINRLIKVADTLHDNNPWSEETSYPSFQLPASLQETDQPLKDIEALAKDIRAYSSSLQTSSADFTPTLKFENEYVPKDAIDAIQLFFDVYATFDHHDLQNLKAIVALDPTTFSSTSNKIMACLTALYSQVPHLPQCKDVFGMIILIHETYDSISSQNNIQGNILQCIMNYGVTNNDSPADFANELHGFMHNAHKLRQTIDKRLVFAALKKHFQDKPQIDSLIRTSILSVVNQTAAARSEIVDVIRAMQELTIQYACPPAALSPFMAAATTMTSPIATQLSPSQIH